MGCCASIFTCENGKMNSTLSEHYVATSVHRRIEKKNYTTHVSTGSSSGVSSACTSPSRHSSPPLSNSEKLIPKPKTCNIAMARKPTAFEMLSVCDDFGEADKIKENLSFGYYSESMSIESSVSTPTQSCLRCTQDTSDLLESPTPPSPPDLKMEMYMLALSPGLMPKTSSPILRHRDIIFNAVATESPPPSDSYRKWVNYLKGNPTNMLNNITNIPEALAGHFSPLNFPAFTDLEDIESAPNIFKEETFLANKSKGNLTHTITTDL